MKKQDGRKHKESRWAYNRRLKTSHCWLKASTPSLACCETCFFCNAELKGVSVLPADTIWSLRLSVQYISKHSSQQTILNISPSSSFSVTRPLGCRVSCWPCVTRCLSLLSEKTCLVALSLKSTVPWCSETWGRGSASMTRTTRWVPSDGRSESFFRVKVPRFCQNSPHLFVFLHLGRTHWRGAPRSTATPRVASATASCPAMTTAL